MKSEHRILRNRGSMIIEVTLIMSLILMIMVLLITLLLAVLRQAEVHSALMTEYTSHENKRADEVERMDILTDVEKETKGDRRIYSKSTELMLVQRYGIVSTEQQVIRMSNVEDKLRRWQVFGDVLSE